MNYYHFFENSDFDNKFIYYEADYKTRQLINPRIWFKKGEVINDEINLTGYQLSLSICTKCFSDYLQLENFNQQHN